MKRLSATMAMKFLPWREMLEDCSDKSSYASGMQRDGETCHCLDGTDELPGKCPDIKRIVQEMCQAGGESAASILSQLENTELLCKILAGALLVGVGTAVVRGLYR